MEITREADYAIRCVHYLAENPEEIADVGEIAEDRDIPKHFLAKILQKLSKAGIVKSIRGVKGGFMLAKPPAKINLLDVIEAVQGTLEINICVVDRKKCKRSSFCTVHPVWVDVQADIKKKLVTMSFQSLLRKKKSSRKGKNR